MLIYDIKLVHSSSVFSFVGSAADEEERRFTNELLVSSQLKRQASTFGLHH